MVYNERLACTAFRESDLLLSLWIYKYTYIHTLDTQYPHI